LALLLAARVGRSGQAFISGQLPVIPSLLRAFTCLWVLFGRLLSNPVFSKLKVAEECQSYGISRTRRLKVIRGTAPKGNLSAIWVTPH
jgi:hypothetical protein